MKTSIYLDYNATSPIRSEVKEAMDPFLADAFGNPSSSYAKGQEARHAVDEAREKVAQLIHASPHEIFFTSCGTESNNLALVGAALNQRNYGRHLVVDRMEHMAVVEPVKFIERELGFEVTYLETDSTGRISKEAVEKAVQLDTVLFTLMAANNETGVVQPIQEISEAIHGKNTFFHCDAVQALGKIPVNVTQWKVNSLAFSGHKIGAPKGVGVLYLRKGSKIQPFLRGGHQEGNLRPGTENVAGIVGFGKACELIEKEWDQRQKQYLDLRKLLEKYLFEIPDTHLNGDPEHRLPTTANVSFEGISGERLLIRLDMKGIAVSSGSACTSGSIEPSHVLTAMGSSEGRARSAIRFSLGFSTTKEEIEKAGKIVQEVVKDLRAKKTVYSAAKYSGWTRLKISTTRS